MEDASFIHLVSRKHRQYRIHYKFLRHPIRHMVSEYFAGHNILDHAVINKSLARSQVCNITCQTHSWHYREFLISKDIRISFASCSFAVCQALGSMPVVARVQIHVSHVLGTSLAPKALIFFTQLHGNPVRSVCSSAFVELFFDSLFKMCFPFLKKFPFSEPGIISCSLYF